jgi:hypothetical protein
MSTIQIELTSSCVKRCSNCTRFSGTKQKEFFLSEEEFHKAIDSLVEYSRLPHAMVGLMGGDPVLHPQFADFCEYALSKIERNKLGLWSTFPDAPKYRAYGPLIVKTFGNILLNDHSTAGIKHAPVLMASEEYFRKPCGDCGGTGVRKPYDEEEAGKDFPCSTCTGKGTVTDDVNLFAAVDRCWVQESWSASINAKGAFFCEVAAALSDLFDGPEGWPVEKDWWKRTPKDFQAQMDWACRKCGAALPIERLRDSQDNRDDVSPGNLERLKEIKSRKVARGEYALREEFTFDRKLVERGTYPDQSPYKDEHYRQTIASRYGIRLVMNPRGYWEPTMAPKDWKPAEPPKPLFEIFSQQR